MTYLDPKADLTFKKVFGEHEPAERAAAFPNAGGRSAVAGIFVI